MLHRVCLLSNSKLAEPQLLQFDNHILIDRDLYLQLKEAHFFQYSYGAIVVFGCGSPFGAGTQMWLPVGGGKVLEQLLFYHVRSDIDIVVL
jgi:hypothetical protein